MTLTPEQKLAVDRSGFEPVRVEDPGSGESFFIVREAVYRELRGLVGVERLSSSSSEYAGIVAITDDSDLTLHEFEEFVPDA